MENFLSVIPTCSTASCPKCSGNVILKKHANSASIENMNDCLHHGICENCSCVQHEFFVSIACLQHPCAWGYHRNCGILVSWKALSKLVKSPTHKNAMESWHDQMHSQSRSNTHHGTAVTAEDLDSNFMMVTDDYSETNIKNRTQLNDQLPPPKVMTVGKPVYLINDIKQHGFTTSSHSPEFYWCEHHFPGTGPRNLTAKAFSLLVDEVTTEEAHFSLTISSLLLQLTKEQQALLGECMLQVANSKDSGLSVLKNTCSDIS